MAKKALRFKNMKLRESPGLEHGLAPFEEFSQGINIIAGPNAAGKSSAARALQQLLGADSQERISAQAGFTIEDETWLSEIKSGHKSFRKNGVKAELTGIPGAADQPRYLLSIQDLLLKKDTELADEILREAVGGYDLEAAKTKLGYSDSRRQKTVSEFKAYEAAAKNVSKITREQKALQDEERKLQSLKKSREEAENAAKKAGFLDLTAAFRAEENKKNSISQALKGFPEIMELVRPQDFEDVKRAQDEISGLNSEISTTESNIASFKIKLADLGLPESGIDIADTEQAANLLKELEKQHNLHEKTREEIAGKEEELQRLAEKTGVSAEVLTGLNPEELKRTEEEWNRLFDSFGGLKRLQNAAVQLQTERNEQEIKEEQLQKAVNALENWLSDFSGEGKPVSKADLAGIVISALATAILIQLFGLPGFAGLLLVLFFAIRLFQRTGNSGSSTEALRRKDFEQTGVKAPGRWTPKEAGIRLIALRKELGIVQELSQIEHQITQKEKEFAGLKENAEQLAGQLRIAANGAAAFDSYTSLFWYVNELLHYSHLLSETRQKNAILHETAGQQSALLRKFNAVTEEYGLETAADFVDAEAQKSVLDKRDRMFEEIVRRIEREEQEQENLLKNKKKAEETALEIFSRLELTPGDIYEVKTLTDRLPEFNNLKNQLREAEAFAERAADNLRNHSLYSDLWPDTKELAPDEIEEEIRKFYGEADKIEAFKKQIIEIENDIARAKASHTLEDALQKQDEALAGLEALYRTNAQAVLGDLLVKELNRRLNKENMPAVFDRAKALFSRFTHSRYELIVNPEGGKARFSALDAQDGKARELEELSSGTRIQLLLAVRLAFIEHSEQEIALPVFADELLANSDDRRAEAIMDVLIEISRSGRQVFYFTAQGDEVAKWRQKLEKATYKGAVYKVNVIKSGEEFKIPNPSDFGIIEESLSLHTYVPGPAGHSYEEYGKLLNVPSVNLFSEAQRLHLWYFMDDVKLLYGLLRRQIVNPAMLQNFLQEGGRLDGLEEAQIQKIQNKVTFADYFFSLKRTGKSKPLTRQIIEDSGAVTDTFMEEVVAVLEKHQFNPEKLLHALDAGEVTGFRTNKKEELRDYLLSEGYLSQKTPLTDEEISLKLSAYLTQNDISVEEAEDLLKRLGQGI